MYNLISINSTSIEVLRALPYITPDLAVDILEIREKGSITWNALLVYPGLCAYVDWWVASGVIYPPGIRSMNFDGLYRAPPPGHGSFSDSRRWKKPPPSLKLTYDGTTDSQSFFNGFE